MFGMNGYIRLKNASERKSAISCEIPCPATGLIACAVLYLTLFLLFMFISHWGLGQDVELN